MTNLPLPHSEQQALPASTAGRVERLNIFGPAPLLQTRNLRRTTNFGLEFLLS